MVTISLPLMKLHSVTVSHIKYIIYKYADQNKTDWIYKFYYNADNGQQQPDNLENNRQEDCACLVATSNFNDTNCKSSHGIVCQMSPVPNGQYSEILKLSKHTVNNLFIWLGFNVALTHQNRSYRDSETKENVEAQKRKQRWGHDRNKHN